MSLKALMVAGIAASTAYAIAVVLGGVLWPTYSHFSQPVSDLIADGAPTKRFLDPLFALYNLLTLAFGLGMLGLVRTRLLRHFAWSWPTDLRGGIMKSSGCIISQEASAKAM